MLSGAASRGILYIEDFDAPPADATSAPDIVVQRLLPEDIEAAREDGRREGAQAALAEAEATGHALRAAAVQALADALRGMRDAVEAAAQREAASAATALQAMLAAALPHAAGAAAREENAALLRAVLPALRHAPQAVLRVHPDLVDAMAEDLAPLTAEWPAPPRILADPALPPPALRLIWEEAEITRDLAPLWAALRATLPRYALPAATPEPETAP